LPGEEEGVLKEHLLLGVYSGKIAMPPREDPLT